jgi:hypothetical protein
MIHAATNSATVFDSHEKRSSIHMGGIVSDRPPTCACARAHRRVRLAR